MAEGLQPVKVCRVTPTPALRPAVVTLDASVCGRAPKAANRRRPPPCRVLCCFLPGDHLRKLHIAALTQLPANSA
ncbi:L-ascorbate oxidase-like protein [Anopheles sinensis]|uniref:L-ascorbate oxidase-like protein n=1 Tax=Anopheles sinensis TaxID=74873 RepID=A0A084VQ83_ANOSI|nr:L-ascorbate oxidase-like protein [Anopheles sinensis]